MSTGDASINADASSCCTAEVLSNMALRLGAALDVPYVVMDEFHYYADKERGVAWQVPLLVLPGPQFLLMSATLGDTRVIAERLQRDTGREVAHVTSERPVPLDFEYVRRRSTRRSRSCSRRGRSPIYVVNFTQRECAELALLTSVKLGTTEEREEIPEDRRDPPRDAVRQGDFEVPVRSASASTTRASSRSTVSSSSSWRRRGSSTSSAGPTRSASA